MVNNNAEKQMSKIESLDQKSANALIPLLNEDLKELGKKYGLLLRINGGKLITDTAVQLKLEVTIEGTGSVKKQRVTEALDKYAELYLPGIDITKPIPHPNLGTITINGLNTRAYKTPILAQASKDGVTYRFTVDQIISLHKKAVIA
jgi:hypothetical protein